MTLYPLHYHHISQDVSGGFSIASKKCYDGLKGAGAVISDNVKSAAYKTKKFFINNWKEVLGFTAAWGVIITGMGLMYGFSAVAMPLSIGLACGFAFGILMGVVVKKAFKIQTKEGTIWGKLNYWFNKLDPNGTRAIVISIVVTVVLASTVVFPIAMGVVFGIITASHLVILIALEKDFGSEKTIENDFTQVKTDLAAAEITFDALKQRIKDLEEQLQEKDG